MEVVSTFVGVASFGLQVCGSLLVYYQSWKSCNESIKDLCQSIENVEDILQLLQDSVGRRQQDLASSQGVEDSMERLAVNFGKLNTKLEKIKEGKGSAGFWKKAKAQLTRVSYPFKESTIMKLRDLIHYQECDLLLALHTLQIDTTSVSVNGIHDLGQKFDQLSLDVARVGVDVAGVKDAFGSSEKARHRLEILKWLSPVDPSSNHEAACERREPETGDWFLEGPELSSWKSSSSLLWINGNIGCGKSVLCSAIIEHARLYCATNQAFILAYFYFSFSDIRKQTALACLSSLTRQLCENRPIPASLQQLYDQCKKEHQSTSPSLNAVKAILGSVIEELGQVFIVIDALDECLEDPDEQQRAEMLRWIIEASSRHQNAHILFTSRNEHDIANLVQSFSGLINVPIDSTRNREDIRRYISSQFKINTNLRKLASISNVNMEDILLNQADGMFQWIHCQLRELKSLKLVRQKDVDLILNSHPRTLYDVYFRVLEKVDQRNSAEASKALQWLSNALRPLCKEEVNEACIINLDDKIALDEQSRILAGGIEILLSSFVTERSAKDGFRQISISHCSVKEFLTSDAIRQSPYLMYGFRDGEAHALITESCIAYMSYYSSSPTKTCDERDLEKFPLLDYACRFWFEHFNLAREHHERLNPVVIKLLNSGSIWEDCIEVYDPFCSWHRRPFTNWRKAPRLSSALCRASALGLDSVAEQLLDEGAEINECQDLPSSGSVSALVIATIRCHENMVKLLIRRGAAVNFSATGYGTALHVAVAFSEDEHKMERMAKILLEAGADPNDTRDSCPPLHRAAWRGHTGICKLLLHYGADPNISYVRDETWDYEDALSAAASMGEEAAVELLLESGAIISDGALYFALYGTGEDPDEVHKRITEVFIRRGADLSPDWPYGYDKPITIALLNGWGDIAKLMLEHGAQVEPSDEDDLMAGNILHAAVIHGDAEIVALLLDRGVDIEAPGIRNEMWCEYYATPLQAAANLLHIEVATLLLNRNADVNAQGGPYGSALFAVGAATQWKLTRGLEEADLMERAKIMVNLLMSHGADVHSASGWRYPETEIMCIKAVHELLSVIGEELRLIFLDSSH